MLRLLLEYIMFADSNISCQLSENAKIYFHIANKQLPLENTITSSDIIELTQKQLQEQAHAMGFEGYKSNKINSVYSSGDLREYFRTLTIQWKSHFELEENDSKSINYKATEKENESSSLLYLADILVGNERYRHKSKETKENTGFKEIVSPTIEIIYNNITQVRIKLVRYYKTGQMKLFFHTLKSMTGLCDDENIKNIISDMFQSNYELYQKEFREYMTEILQDIDNPGIRTRVLNTMYVLLDIFHKLKIKDVVIDFYENLIKISLANHCGNIQEANQCWNHYQEISSTSLSLESELFKKITFEYDIRYVVTLMDSFAFTDADSFLNKRQIDEKSLIENMQKQSGTTIELQDRKLGIYLNEIGQVYAFQPNDRVKRKKAEKMFRLAISNFNAPADKEYSWVYMIHLACDRPSEQVDLWQESSAEILRITNKFSDLSHPFALAAFLKGIWVFKETEKWSNLIEYTFNSVNALSEEVLQYHPYGLILQNMAEIFCFKAYNDNSEYLSQRIKECKECFDKAINSFHAGNKLLRLLEEACRLRKALFQAKLKLDKMNPETLLLQGEKFRNAIKVYLAQCSPPEEVERRIQHFNLRNYSEKIETENDYILYLLKNIRFNYW